MKPHPQVSMVTRFALGTIVLSFLFASAARLNAQAASTASRAYQISAFGGLSGTYTGLEGGRNLAITGGADVTLRSFFRLRPSLEVRGTFPVNKGHVDSQRNLLGGIVLARPFGRFTPYADFLAGGGEIDYGAGLPTPDHTLLYLKSGSTVLSPGGGLNLGVTDHLALKADVQIQRYSTPVTLSGHIYAKPLTLGLVYTFNVGRFAGGRFTLRPKAH